jgi:heme-degrading monooxygenase HmoA
MIAVIFEVWPSANGKEPYLDLAAKLRPQLEAIDGFISIERFQSLAFPTKLLSLSFWRDEAAVAEWRNSPHHREAQALGRAGIFLDYRIRVAQTIRDYSLDARTEAPRDSLDVHARRTNGAE